MLRDCILFEYELHTGFLLELFTLTQQTAEWLIFTSACTSGTVHCLLAYCLVNP